MSFTGTMTAAQTTAATTEITVLQASEAHDIDKRTILRAIERGLIPARRIGPMYVIDAEAARLYGDVFRARRALDAYTGRDTVDE